MKIVQIQRGRTNFAASSMAAIWVAAWPLPSDCLKIANQVAGLSTLKLGAGNSMPKLSDLS